MRASLPVVLCALSGCITPAAEERVPAVRIEPYPESQASLENAIATALGKGPVTLAPDALTDSSYLHIETAQPRDADGRLLQGRLVQPPEVFRLFRQGEECVLIHERTKQEFVLTGAKCAEETKVE